MVNKKAWIRIVEAFVAILLISVFLLIILNQDYVEKKDFSSEIYENQVGILTEIQLDSSLREEILALTLPVEWGGVNFPENIKIKISEKQLDFLTCEAKICEISDECNLEQEVEKNIYAKSVMIVANSETYSPRVLKLFCWRT